MLSDDYKATYNSSWRLIDAHQDLIKIWLSFTVYCGMQGICYNM